MKKYKKTVWEDRVVQHPNRYKDQNGNELILTQNPGDVYSEGTNVDALKLNKIEDALEKLSEPAKFITQEEYNMLETKEENMFYMIKDKEKSEIEKIYYNGAFFTSSSYKGIAPKDVSNISTDFGNNKIVVAWTDPGDTVIDDVIISKWVGTKLVYKLGEYPQNEYDGILAVDNKVLNQYSTNGFTITGLENGQTYYLALFPYSEYGAVNISENNRTSQIPNEVYGVRKGHEYPYTSWERTHDAINLIANATHGDSEVQNDFDNIYPWSDIISCNVDDNGNIIAYYGDAEFKFDGTNGQVMTLIPEFYWKRGITNDNANDEYIQIAPRYIEGFTKSESFLIGRYTMSGDKNKVYSRSGYMPIDEAPDNTRNYASALGTGWQQLDWHWFLLQFLYLVEYANTDSQLILGHGNVDNSETVISGGCDTLGMKSGCIVDDYKHSVIYRGIEDIYGNIFQTLDGVKSLDLYHYVTTNPSDYSASGKSSAYYKIRYSNPSNSTTFFVTSLIFDEEYPIFALPSYHGNGSDSTYYCDIARLSYSSTNSYPNQMYVGGTYQHNTNCGLWYFHGISLAGFGYCKTGRLLKPIERSVN